MQYNDEFRNAMCFSKMCFLHFQIENFCAAIDFVGEGNEYPKQFLRAGQIRATDTLNVLVNIQ